MLNIGRFTPAVHKTKDARYLYVCFGGLKLNIINNVERLDLNNESGGWEKIKVKSGKYLKTGPSDFIYNVIALISPFEENKVIIIGNNAENIEFDINNNTFKNTKSFKAVNEIVKTLPLVLGNTIHILAVENIYRFSIGGICNEVQIIKNKGLMHI